MVTQRTGNGRKPWVRGWSKVRRAPRRWITGTFAIVALLLAVGAIVTARQEDGRPESPSRLRSSPSGHAERARFLGPQSRQGQPPKPIGFTVEANGDLLIHSPIFQRALSLGRGRHYDFAPMLRLIKHPVTEADLAICHVETPMTTGRPSGYPVFNTPPSLARAIKSTGWDVCDTASNHSLDRGQAGIDQTVAALNRAGVKHTGSFRSRAERRRLLLVDVRGVKVAFLAYTETTNGIPLPRPWSLNLARTKRILADAHRARRHGAQVVIVNLHWGAEYQHAPSTSQLRLARALTRSDDVTAVIGQHVHVVQPIRRMNGKVVVFGEGNLLSNQTTACCPTASQDGILALIDFVVDARGARAERVRYVPTWVRHPDFVVLPIGTALHRRLYDPATLRASYKRTVAVVGRGRRIRPIPPRLP
jgi:hypothetical protein